MEIAFKIRIISPNRHHDFRWKKIQKITSGLAYAGQQHFSTHSAREENDSKKKEEIRWIRYFLIRLRPESRPKKNSEAFNILLLHSPIFRRWLPRRNGYAAANTLINANWPACTINMTKSSQSVPRWKRRWDWWSVRLKSCVLTMSKAGIVRITNFGSDEQRIEYFMNKVQAAFTPSDALGSKEKFMYGQ